MQGKSLCRGPMLMFMLREAAGIVVEYSDDSQVGRDSFGSVRFRERPIAPCGHSLGINVLRVL
jgi:hypothetical protein